MEAYVWLIPALPLAAFIINFLLGKRVLRAVPHYIATAAVLGSFLLSCLVFVNVMNGAHLDQELYRWIESGPFEVAVGFLVDPLSAIMLIVVTGVASLVHIFSIGYMHGDGGFYRFFAYLPLFVFSMLMLVLSPNLLQMFVFWEAVGLCSYLLIGFWFFKQSASNAANKAFIVNRVGDFGFAIGIMLVFVLFGTLQFHEIFEAVGPVVAQNQGLLTWVTILLFMGAIGKSAQFPLHVWLPDAMEGPTPVSALIHAATMVTAGIYMVARLQPLYVVTPTTLAIVAAVGAITAFLGASIALVQNDIKRVVAYSTVSQLGYMTFALGIGAWVPAIFHLFTHAFFKGLLFLGSGSVIHGMHEEQDIRKMGGLRKYMPVTALTFLFGSLANAGIVPFAGFWSKDEILASALLNGRFIIYAIGLITAFLTAFYMFRLYFLVFEGAPRFDTAYVHPHESPGVMTLPLIVLAAASLLVGLLVGWPPENGFIHHFLEPAFEHGAAEEHHVEAGLTLTNSILATLAAVGGLALAFLMYRRGSPSPAALGARFQRLYRFLLGKWYFDEIYDTAFVRGTRDVAFGSWFFDRHVIDGLVNGTAAAVVGASGQLRRLQTGFVGNYALAIAFGLVLFVGIYLVTAALR